MLVARMYFIRMELRRSGTPNMPLLRSSILIKYILPTNIPLLAELRRRTSQGSINTYNRSAQSDRAFRKISY